MTRRTASVDITVQAVVQPKSLDGMAMIVFRDAPAAQAGVAAVRRLRARWMRPWAMS